jgi:hypothetical protein
MPTDATASASPIPPSEDSFAARADRAAVGALRSIEGFIAGAWHLLRFIFFAFYLVLVVVNFWLWVISGLFGLVRFVLRVAMVALLWLSGGHAPRTDRPSETVGESIKHDLQDLWNQRLRAYESIARPVARHVVSAKYATRTFWHWPIRRKVASLVVVALFILVPGLYVIPRPHYVQVTDDNAMDYTSDGSIRYFIHTVDLFDPDQTREYINEDAPWLGKINSQGLKSQLVPGRNYRFWVVGIRWYWMPRLFPNVIGATEVDSEGRNVANPSRLVLPNTTAPTS